MQTDEIMLYQENARSVVYRRLADLFRPPGPELPGVLEELESALGRLDSAALEAASRLTRSYFEHSDSCSLKSIMPAFSWVRSQCPLHLTVRCIWKITAS